MSLHLFIRKTFYWQNGLLYTGGEDRNITAWDTNSGKVAYCIEDAHKSRVKGIVKLTKNGSAGDGDEPHFMASASSDGVIRVWEAESIGWGQHEISIDLSCWIIYETC